jgi:hypothetical protein
MEHIKEILKGLHEEFGWLVWGLVGIGFIWFFNGGANNPSAHEGAYIKPLAPLDSGRVYGTYYAGTPVDTQEKINLSEIPANIVRGTETLIEGFFEKSKAAAQIHANSLLAQKIFIDGMGGARATKASAEYIRIVADPKATGSTQISGLSLSGTMFDGRLPIPRGSNLLILGETNLTRDISLTAGDRAIISTGVSPVGYSFRVNMCSGYLNQSGTYTPALRNECPRNMSCAIDPLMGLTYSSCVDSHKNDSNFYSNEWRIFLGQSTELWKQSNEIIKLLDTKGNVVDALTY